MVVPLILRRLALLEDASPARLVDAEARRRVALASLREVEYDRVSGKLDDEDYQRLKAKLEREALAALAAAEAAGGAAGAGAEGTGSPSASSSPVRHSCGFVNPPASRFCAGCGRPLV